MENNFINSLFNCRKENKWKEALYFINEERNILANSDSIIKKISWVWPTEDNLYFINKYVKKMKLNCITSIGCGAGLLEWLLQQYTGMEVRGIEIDKNWWKSVHAPSQFIRLQLLDDINNLPTTGSDSAIMFCYYNDEVTFQKYLQKYLGPLLIIIGPSSNCKRVTNPTPFSPNFGSNEKWKLIDHQEMVITKDVVAVYTRIQIDSKKVQELK